MSRPKKFNDYSYGVGLEYNASSYKQVKDAMKSNMDDLLKLAKSYSEAIKVDPDIDLSKMVSAFKEFATIIDQTKKSGNPFGEFVDKGVLNRVASLEQNVQLLTQTSSELKQVVDHMFDGIKDAGSAKFPGTFDSLFTDKSKEINATREAIKALNSEIDKLEDLSGPSSNNFNNVIGGNKLNKASIKEVKEWIEEYKKLEDELSDADFNDIEKISSILQKMQLLGSNLGQAIKLPNIKNSKDFSDFSDFYRKASISFEESVDDLNEVIEKETEKLRIQREKFENELKQLETIQKKFNEKNNTNINNKRANKKGATNLGTLDQVVDVYVKPKVDPTVWKDILNKKLGDISAGLDPIVLKATFSNKSKNLKKELDGNIAAINHTVKAEFKIEDNFGDESDPNSFFGKLRKLDSDLQEAKDKLSSKTQFKVRFAFESGDGSVVTNVKSYVQNQFRNIPVTLHVKNGKSFMTSINNMISGVKGNFEKSLSDVPVSFKIKNEEELLQSVNKLKETIGADMSNIGVGLVANGIINIGDAAEEATEDVRELNDSVEKLNTGSKKKSPSVEAMLNEYDKLETKINSVYKNKQKFLEVYGSTDEAGFAAYDRDVKRRDNLAKKLGPVLDEHLQAKELDKLSDSAVSAQKNINKAKDALADLNKHKFNSEFFIKIGFVKDGVSVGDPSGSLKEMVDEWNALSAKIHQETQKPGSVYDSNTSGRKQYNKDVERLTFLEKNLGAALQNQVSYLKAKEVVSKKILETKSKEVSLHEGESGSKSELTQDAVNAEKKYAQLNETIQKTEDILKNLNGRKGYLKNTDQTYQFTQLGEWDKDTKKFKRNKEDMKKLLADYRQLHKENKAANITDVNNPNLKKEVELRQKITNIIKDQRKHLRESLKEQQKQRDAALKTMEAYKAAPTNASLNAKKSSQSKTKTDTSSDVQKLQDTIKAQEDIINSLNKKGRNSEYFTKLGRVDKETGTFKKDTAEVSKMLARYKELAAMKKRTSAQDAEKKKLNGQLTQILIAQKKQANEILEKNKQDLAVLQNKENVTNNTTKKSTTKKATNKGTATSTGTGTITAVLSDDRLTKLIDITGKILAEVKSTKSKTKTQKGTTDTNKSNTTTQSGTTTTSKQSNKQILSLSRRLGKVTAQRDALPEGSAERAAIEDRIKLIRKEILEKQKSGKVDQQLMQAAFKLGQEEQRITTNITHGRKEDVKVVKEEIDSTKELISLYQKLGQIDEEISSKDGYERLALEDERARIQSQIDAKQSSYTEAEIEAYVKAREDARIKINKQFAKKEDSAEIKEETSNIRELTNAYSNLGKMQADLEYTTGSRARNELEDQIEKQKLLIQEKQKGINVDENLLDSQRVIAYNKQVDKLRLSEAKRFDKVEEADRKNAFKNVYGLQEVDKATKSRNNIRGQALSDEFKNSNIVSNALNDVENAYSKLIAKQQQFKDGNPAQDEIDEFKILADQYDQARVNLEGIIKSSRDLANNALDGKIIDVDDDLSDFDKLKQKLIETAQRFDGTGIKVEGFDETLKRLDYRVKQQDGTWANFAVQLNMAGNQIVGITAKAKNAETTLSSFLRGSLNKFKNAMQVFSGYDLFFEAIAQVKKGVQYVRDIDTALTELKKVTDETEESYSNFLQTASKTAAAVGSTVKDITTMTADWSRLGYSIEQASSLAESTAVLLNVSEFSDANQASEALISTIQAYGYAADESMSVVDILNEVGNNFAVSSDGLATALQTSASALMSAGNDLNQSVALVAAANKVLQDPSQVGAALRTIALRIRGTSVQVLEEMGEETDGVVESVSKLQEKVKAISGVNILDESGAYRDTYEILRDLAGVWDEIGQSDPKGQAALLELLAGKNRSNALAAILTNLEDIEGAYEAALNAEGSASRELATYMDSIEGKVNKFTNAVQTMWMNTIKSDYAKWFVDLGTKLIELIDSFGLLKTILAGIVVYFTGKKYVPTLFTSLITHSKGAVTAITAQIAAMKALNAAQAAGVASETALTVAKTKNVAITGTKIVDMLAEANATVSNTALDWLAAHAEENLTRQKILAAVASGELAKADAVAMLATTGLAGSVKALWAAFLASPLAPIIAALAAVTAAIALIDVFTTSFKEAKKELEETTEELNSVRSELEAVNNELETTASRIKELEGKGKLSFVEEQELKKLKEQNAELERQQKILEATEKREHKKQVDAAMQTMSKDKNLQDQWAANGTGNPSINVGNKFETTLNSLEGAYREVDRLKKLQNRALEVHGADSKEFKDLEKQIKNAEKKVDDLNASYDKMASDWEENYGHIGYIENATEDWEKEWNQQVREYQDNQLRQAVINKDITAGDALDSVFSSKGTEAAQKFSEAFTNKINSNEFESLEDATSYVNDALESNVDLAEQLDYIGIKAEDVAGYFIDLNEAVSDSTVANQKLARSQKRLEYYKLAKQLNSYVNNLENLTDEEKKELQTTRNRLKVLAAEIDAYDILSDQINAAKSSFEEFENAKTRDSENDYMDDTAEMLKTIVDGYQSAKMGTEAFQSAFTSLIPESAYEEITTLQGKYEAGAKYIRDVIGRYFKFEYDDEGLLTSVEATSKGLETFFTDMSNKKGPNGEPLMSFTNGVWKVNETDWDNFVKYSGLTEEALYAIGMAADTVDADWIMGDDTTFLSSFDESLEAKIYNTTKALADLDEQLIDNLANVESQEERDELMKQYAESYRQYSDEIAGYTDEAIKNINAYNESTKKVNEATAELASAKEALASATTEEEIQIATDQVEEASAKLSTALTIKNDLSAPTELELTFAQDSISAQIAAIQAQWTNKEIVLPVIIDGELAENELIRLNDEGKYVVNTELKGLTDEEMATLQGYADLVNTQGVINVYMENYKEEEDKLKTLNELVDGLEETLSNLSVEVEATQAIKKLKEIKGISDSIKDKTVTITTVEETVDAGTRKPNLFERIFGYGSASGTAYAQGSWAAGVSTNKALVGELGPELRVRNGQYEVIGANGAEFTDVKPNDIIFNHKQTEEIFKNGHINSRGKAYSSGTMYTGGAIAPAYGGTVPNWFPHDSTLQNLGTSIDSAGSSDDFDELFDWFEILVEEIDEQISLMEAQLENSVGIDSKKNIYGGLINAEYKKIEAYNQGINLYTRQANKFLSEIPAQYRAMAKDGSISITEFVGEANEKTVEAINNYREWAQKAADLNVQLEEAKAHISDLRVETQSMIADEYENKIGLITHLNDTLEAEMDLLEESGERSSANFYNEMIKNSESQLKLLQSKRNAMQAELDSAVKSGDVAKYSDDWYEMVNAIYDVDDAIIETQTNIESFNNSIQELHWDNFEKIMDAIVAVSDEAEQLRDLIDDTDITEELDPKQWSKDGLTALGLVAQQMENAKYRSELYAAEIEHLNKEFKAGNYTQDEYNEKLKELKDNQWDAIDAYESAKDAIIDLNKTRVEAIKDGIQKEIDAYEELINKRKEDLNSQKEAHDWAETVADHQKTIDDIQRKIDAMEGDQSAAAAAARKKLQEELKVAQEEYDETLYDHSIETQQKALDKSLETYREEQEGKMEELDAWLEKEEQVIAESYAIISANTEAIHSNIEAISDKYGIEIEKNVVEPWTAGVNALGTYGTELDTATSQYVIMLGRVKQELINLQKQADATANSIIKAANTKATNTQAAVKDPNKQSYKPTTTYKPSTSGGSYGGGSGSSVSVGQNVTVKSSATHFARDGGNGTKMQSWVPGHSFTVMQTSGNQVLIGINGAYTGWVYKNDLVGYAKGTTGVKSNQLAWVDENGLEEIVMHAQDGKLTYLTKGSAVIPNPLVDNIMGWGKIDPKTWLANNRKTTTPVSLTTNNNVIDLSFGSMINIEHADRDSIPEIQDAIKRQLDSYMKNINAGLKKFAR